MRISVPMIHYYLDTITVGYFNDNDLPPDDVRDYQSLVGTMMLKAIQHGDMEILCIALGWLLDNERINLEIFNGGRYPFDTGEMREIIRYVYETIQANIEKPANEIPEEFELVNIILEDWWNAKSGRDVMQGR